MAMLVSMPQKDVHNFLRVISMTCSAEYESVLINPIGLLAFALFLFIIYTLTPIIKLPSCVLPFSPSG